MRKTILKIQHLFPHSEKVLLHLPLGAAAAALALFYTDSPWEMIRNATDIGIMKEVWDYGRNKTITLENWMDLFATIMGGVLVAIWFV